MGGSCGVPAQQEQVDGKLLVQGGEVQQLVGDEEQVQVDDKHQVQGGGVREWGGGEEQVQVELVLDDRHQSLVQVGGALQVQGQVDVQVQAQVLELVGVEEVVGKGQVEVEVEEVQDSGLDVASLASELQN